MPPVLPVTASHRAPLSRSRIGGVQQEPAQDCRLLVEHLVDQVVHDEPVVPGEGRDERR